MLVPVFGNGRLGGPKAKERKGRRTHRRVQRKGELKPDSPLTVYVMQLEVDTTGLNFRPKLSSLVLLTSADHSPGRPAAWTLKLHFESHRAFSQGGLVWPNRPCCDPTTSVTPY